MARSLEDLPTSILEQCSMRMIDRTLAQVGQVSRRLRLATKYAESSRLDCSFVEQGKLDQALSRAELLAAHSASNVNPSPIRKLVALLDESDYTENLEGDKVKSDTVIRILKANKGVARLEFNIRIDSRLVGDCHPDFLSTISALCAAAQRTDTTTTYVLVIQTSGYRTILGPKMDAKVCAILGQFPKNTIESLDLNDLHLHDLKTALDEESALSSLRVLRLRDCHLESNGLNRPIALSSLQKLAIRRCDIPSGLISASSHPLRMLVIEARSGPRKMQEGPSLPMRADFAHLHTLSIRENNVEKDSLKLRLLQNDNVTMPVLRDLRLVVDDAYTLDPSLNKALRRLPSLKRLDLLEMPLNENRLFVEQLAEKEPLGYLALEKACAEHRVKMEVTTSSKTCENHVHLASEMKRIRPFQHTLCRYTMQLDFPAMSKAPPVLDEVLSLTSLRHLSVTLYSSLAGDGEDVLDDWEDRLVGIFRQLSAPKCKVLFLSITVAGEKACQGVLRLLEQIASRPPWPALREITGCCSTVATDNSNGAEDDIEKRMYAAIGEIERQSGVCLSSFEIMKHQRFQW